MRKALLRAHPRGNGLRPESKTQCVKHCCVLTCNATAFGQNQKRNA
jgi:hypothetical protein